MDSKNIDYYINRANSMQPTDQSPRAGSMGYRIDDVILLKYDITRKDERMQKAINDAADRGAKTPRYLGVKEEGNIYWVLQEFAKGKNKIVNEDVGKYFTDLIKAPDEQYRNLLVTMKELYGFDLEISSTNIFYDKDEGFTVIDITGLSERQFDENSSGDINRVISNADSAISTFYYFASWCGEEMFVENSFEREYISYRLLKNAMDLMPSINIDSVDEYYRNYLENRGIFEEFERRIKGLDEITEESIEEVVNLMLEQKTEIKGKLRNIRK